MDFLHREEQKQLHINEVREINEQQKKSYDDSFLEEKKGSLKLFSSEDEIEQLDHQLQEEKELRKQAKTTEDARLISKEKVKNVPQPSADHFDFNSFLGPDYASLKERIRAERRESTLPLISAMDQLEAIVNKDEETDIAKMQAFVGVIKEANRYYESHRGFRLTGRSRKMLIKEIAEYGLNRIKGMPKEYEGLRNMAYDSILTDTSKSGYESKVNSAFFDQLAKEEFCKQNGKTQEELEAGRTGHMIDHNSYRIMFLSAKFHGDDVFKSTLDRDLEKRFGAGHNSEYFAKACSARTGADYERFYMHVLPRYRTDKNGVPLTAEDEQAREKCIKILLHLSRLKEEEHGVSFAGGTQIKTKAMVPDTEHTEEMKETTRAIVRDFLKLILDFPIGPEAASPDFVMKHWDKFYSFSMSVVNFQNFMERDQENREYFASLPKTVREQVYLRLTIANDYTMLQGGFGAMYGLEMGKIKFRDADDFEADADYYEEQRKFGCAGNVPEFVSQAIKEGSIKFLPSLKGKKDLSETERAMVLKDKEGFHEPAAMDINFNTCAWSLLSRYGKTHRLLKAIDIDREIENAARAKAASQDKLNRLSENELLRDYEDERVIEARRLAAEEFGEPHNMELIKDCRRIMSDGSYSASYMEAVENLKSGINDKLFPILFKMRGTFRPVKRLPDGTPLTQKDRENVSYNQAYAKAIKEAVSGEGATKAFILTQREELIGLIRSGIDLTDAAKLTRMKGIAEGMLADPGFEGLDQDIKEGLKSMHHYVFLLARANSLEVAGRSGLYRHEGRVCRSRKLIGDRKLEKEYRACMEEAEALGAKISAKARTLAPVPEQFRSVDIYKANITRQSLEASERSEDREIIALGENVSGDVYAQGADLMDLRANIKLLSPYMDRIKNEPALKTAFSKYLEKLNKHAAHSLEKQTLHYAYNGLEPGEAQSGYFVDLKGDETKKNNLYKIKYQAMQYEEEGLLSEIRDSFTELTDLLAERKLSAKQGTNAKELHLSQKDHMSYDYIMYKAQKTMKDEVAAEYRILNLKEHKEENQYLMDNLSKALKGLSLGGDKGMIERTLCGFLHGDKEHDEHYIGAMVDMVKEIRRKQENNEPLTAQDLAPYTDMLERKMDEGKQLADKMKLLEHQDYNYVITNFPEEFSRLCRIMLMFTAYGETAIREVNNNFDKALDSVPAYKWKYTNILISAMNAVENQGKNYSMLHGGESGNMTEKKYTQMLEQENDINAMYGEMIAEDKQEYERLLAGSEWKNKGVEA